MFSNFAISWEEIPIPITKLINIFGFQGINASKKLLTFISKCRKNQACLANDQLWLSHFIVY